MDDLIKRQDAIDEVNNHRYVFKNKHLNDYEQGWNDACDYCADEWLEQLPSAQQWIPCSERLPDQNGKYLVVGRQKAINILKFDGGRWYGKWGVVAWMPLPASPYREEDTE